MIGTTGRSEGVHHVHVGTRRPFMTLTVGNHIIEHLPRLLGVPLGWIHQQRRRRWGRRRILLLNFIVLITLDGGA